MSALFLVRDEAALRQCRGTRAQLTSDLVFACAELQTAESAEPLWKRGDPATIGLTVSPEAFDQSSFEPAMTALAEWVKSCGSMGHRVVFLELLRDGVTTGDVALFDRIAANLGRGLAVERRRLMPDAAAIAEAFHDINLVCGTRYHGLVLAAMLNRPFVGLTHENKITDICNTFGMPCLEAGTVCGSTLAAVVADTLPRRPNANVVAALAKDAQRNFDAFAAVIRVRDRAAVA
jgi:polysaccharide pyruvyl transferase WcaK-like protein